MKSINLLGLLIVIIFCAHCNKEIGIKGPNQYVVFPYAYKSDGSNALKDSFYLAAYQDTVLNYGMAFTPSKNGKVYLLAFKLATTPPPPDNQVVLYLVDIAANQIMYSTALAYPGPDFYRKDLTTAGNEITVEKGRSYMVCVYTPILNPAVAGNYFLPSFRIFRKDQTPIIPFTEGEITVTCFFKSYPSNPSIPSIPIEDTNGLYGLLDLGYYSTD